MTALARWCVTHRFATVLLWLLVLGGTCAAAAVSGTAYSRDYDVGPTESGRAAALLAEGFGDARGSHATLVWHTARGTVEDAGIRRTMTAALHDVAQLPGVTSVAGPYDAADDGRTSVYGRASVYGRTSVDGRISADRRSAYASVGFAQPASALGSGQLDRVVEVARSASSDGLDIAVGSGAAPASQRGHLAEIVGVCVAAMVLFLAFGSLAASLLPIATALVGVGTAYASTALLGHLMDVADFAPMLGTLIGLGVGIDYALFIVTRHCRSLRQGLPAPEAARDAVTTTGRAVVFAGATVCIALLGMLILRLDFLNGVAVAASWTVLLTVAASVTLLPALLTYIGDRALPRRERRRLARPGTPADPASAFAARWAVFVQRRPKSLAVVALILMAALSLPTLSLRLGTSDQSNTDPGSTGRRAYDLMAAAFGPGSNGPLTLVGEADDAAARAAFDRLPKVLASTSSVAAVTPVTYDASGRIGRLTVVPDSAPQSERTSDLVDSLRDTVLPAAGSDSSLTVHVGGAPAADADFARVVVGKLPLFVGIVVGFGCLLLLLAFRSVGIPLKAAAMNVAAVAASFGVVVAVFQWGWVGELLGLGGAGPIEPFLPVIMVAVLFGLSMDYQVFLVSRMYEEWVVTRDNHRAVRVGLAETSRVINSAAVIMIAVFLAFVLSGDRVIAMFGVALAVAVALDAFVLRTLLVPALMHLLGAANWWLPRWADRLLPRLSIQAPGHAPVALLPSSRTSDAPLGRAGQSDRPDAPEAVPAASALSTAERPGDRR